MRIIAPLLIVAALSAFAYVVTDVAPAIGGGLFGVLLPYAAVAVFVAGFIWKVTGWGRSPVPFRIPTTCGQQKTLPWIKDSKLENPSGLPGVIGRMLLEVLIFRSLFRNKRPEVVDGKAGYVSAKWLWMAGLAFHYSFLTIVIRHTRFFTENVPLPVQIMEKADSFMQIGLPIFYATDAALLGAVAYLFIRRIFVPQVRYISQAADYFPLYLIFSIGFTGVLMRYFTKTHIVGVKDLVMNLMTFSFTVPEGLSPVFYTHIFLVSVLLMYFPFSKLMHLGGVFLSPTRNLANNSRVVRHINPWNYPVKVHTYEEYEDDFREKMKGAGLPLEKE